MVSFPDGSVFGASLTFDFDAEEVWIGEDPANAFRPGILSQGSYGPRIGMPLILDLLRRFGVQATFFVSGRDALRHPRVVERIAEEGHEIAHHGLSHASPAEMDRDSEEAELIEAREIFSALGIEVIGYRSPSWEFSANTLELLDTHGFSYSSNLLNDIRPYRHAGTSIAEVPVSWILDDAPHFWFANSSWEKTIRSTREVWEVWQPEIDGIAELGGHVMLTFHPMLSGRPSRIRLIERSIKHLLDAGAWFGTVAETAALPGLEDVEGALPAAQAPSIETLQGLR